MTGPASRAPSPRGASLLCLPAVAVLACGRSAENPIAACTAPSSLSILVKVRDPISGGAAAVNAIGTLIGGAVNDTLSHSDSLTMRGGNQLGTFTVTIERPGYLTWVASNVYVTQEGQPCGYVLPLQLTVRLHPAIHEPHVEGDGDATLLRINV